MPSRLVKPRRLPTVQNPEFAIHQDYTFEKEASSPAFSLSPTHPAGIEHLNGAYPDRTLAIASFGAANSMKPNGATHQYSNSLSHSVSSSGKLSPDSPYFVSSPSLLPFTPGSGTPRMLSTIRTVPSFEGILSDTSSDAPSISTKTSALSSSMTSNASGISVASQGDRMDTVRLKDSWRAETNGETHSKQQPAISHPDGPSDEHGADEGQSSQPWDSTIGKAGLGKTGRVINKLVSEKEALKRDLDIERLRAEEAKQAARLAEDKMERAAQDYENRLLEANVTKTLLARKERQVESLTATVDLERKKTQAALEREQTWREEMERAQRDTKTQVEEATSYAQMMEGRYNAISSHWKDQGDEVKRVVTKLKGDISVITEERRKDDEKIATLRELCDQQDGNIKELKRQKEDIAEHFEAYKRQQEEMLEDIKVNARAREQEQERLLEETRETLAKLKWALNVNKIFNEAQ